MGCSCRTFREEPLARSVSYPSGAYLTRQNERCHENASDCLRLDRCGGDASDASTCRLLTRLPSRRTMPGVLRTVPAILRSAAAILWSIALLCSAPPILRLLLGQPNHSVILALLKTRVPDAPPLPHTRSGGVLVLMRPSSYPSRQESRKARISSPGWSTHPAGAHNVRALGDRLLPAPAFTHLAGRRQ